jgi:hypothetical protein
MRKLWLAGALAVFGCQSIVGPKAPPVAGLSEAGSTSLPVAPSGLAEASHKTTQPPAPEPADHLALAAACVERGDQPAAAAHLERYVRANPGQLMFRAHLAELLLKTDQPDRARFHFEAFVADAQAATGPARAHLVHCHTRLMEIGQRADDRHAEALHRGIGLLLLVRDQDADPKARDEGFREQTLCRAVRALTDAKELRPTDPRPLVYLAEAHDRAGNRRAADAARSAARTLNTPGSLTAAESRRVALR